MEYIRNINLLGPDETFIYDTVTDGQRFRVRYHKDTPRWSGKWYWLKAPDGTGLIIGEFGSEAEAYADIVADVDRRRHDAARWESVQPDLTAQEHEGDVNADDHPF